MFIDPIEEAVITGIVIGSVAAVILACIIFASLFVIVMAKSSLEESRENKEETN